MSIQQHAARRQASKQANEYRQRYGANHPLTQAMQGHADSLVSDGELYGMEPEDAQAVRYARAREELQAALQEQGARSIQAMLAAIECVGYAPKGQQDQVQQEMQDRFGLPQPGAWAADGRPMYSMEQIGDVLGMTEKHVRATVEALGHERCNAGVPVNFQLAKDAEVHQLNSDEEDDD